MKKLLFPSILAAIAIFPFYPPCVDAQIQSDPVPRARLYETLGKTYDEVVWRIMHGYFVDLSNDPSAEGRSISYGTPRQIAFFERIFRARMKIVKFDPSRITILSGGKRTKPEHQFWIVPAGASPPAPLKEK